MNDDQIGQPQDTEDAQDGSEGNSGTPGMGVADGADGTGDTASMGVTDDTGDMAGTEDSETQAPSMDAAEENVGEEPASQVDTSEGDGGGMDMVASTDAGAGADTTMDSPEDGGEQTSTDVYAPDADTDTSMSADTDADMGTVEDEVEVPYEGRSEQRPDRPPRSQFGTDDNPSDEMVIHTARDPRLDEIASNASMEDLMKASERQYRAIKHGDVIEGTVMKVGRDEIMVDIGGKTEGVISSRESTSLSEAEREALKIGDTLLVSVVQPHNSEGQAVLSLDRARQEKAWRDLQRSFEAGETISAPVVGHNKGGILVSIEGIRGFVPSSQVSSLPPGEANKQAEMARLHNQSIPLKIIEINRHRNRLILSERQAMQEQRESMRARLLLELEPGQIRPGTVTSVCDFGAFVDIGGADGLIHLSELSWKRVSHPSEMLKVGERINVYVLSVDQHERKIALSLKRTQPEPWETITDQYQLGQMVRGTITQITTFGAFARLEDGIEGLIHVSELAEGRVAHPRNVVKEGEVLDLKVIRIDPARKRIGLSLKRVNEDAGAASHPGEAEGASGEGDTSEGGASGGAGTDVEGSAPSLQSQGGATSEQQPGQQAGAPQPRPQQPRPQQPRPQQPRPGGQGQRPPRPPQQPQQPLTSQSEDFEHLGALAAALAAHTQQASTQPASDATQQAEPTTEAVQEEQSDPGEVIGSLSGIDTSADMDVTSAMQADAGAEEVATDTGDTSDALEQEGSADTMPGDKSDTTATTPEMGAFGAESDENDENDESAESGETAESQTDVATDSGDMPEEEAMDGTGGESSESSESDEAPASSEEAGSTGEGADADADTSDTNTGAEASSTGEDADADAGADADAEPQASMPSAEDTEEVSSEAVSPEFTDVAAASGDMPGETAAESSSSSDSEDQVGDGDDADDKESGAPSGSEGMPSTADGDAAEEDKEGKPEE